MCTRLPSTAIEVEWSPLGAPVRTWTGDEKEPPMLWLYMMRPGLLTSACCSQVTWALPLASKATEGQRERSPLLETLVAPEKLTLGPAAITCVLKAAVPTTSSASSTKKKRR